MTLGSLIFFSVLKSEIYEPTLKTQGSWPRKLIHPHAVTANVLLWQTTHLSNMFYAASAFAVLSLVSGFSQCPPDPCQGVVKPARQQDLPPLDGQWIAVSLSLKNNKSRQAVHRSDSFTLHYKNATFLTTKRQGTRCIYQPYNAPLRGVYFNDTLKSRDYPEKFTKFTGTIFSSSCTDCLMMSFDIVSPTYSVQTVTLYSRGREVEQEQLLEFITLVSEITQTSFVGRRRETLWSEWFLQLKLELKMEPGTEKLRIFYFS